MASTTDDVFERDLPPVESRRPIWNLVLAWFVLPLFVLDVAVRRLVSTLALSVYVELAVLAMLCGVCVLVSAGAAGYFAAFLAAECVGWSMRFGMLQSMFNTLLPPASVSAASAAESVAVLRESKRQVRADLDTLGRSARMRNQGESRAEQDAFSVSGTPAVSPMGTAPAGAPTRDHAQPSPKRKPPSGVLDRLQSAKRRAHTRFAAPSEHTHHRPAAGDRREP